MIKVMTNSRKGWPCRALFVFLVAWAARPANAPPLLHAGPIYTASSANAPAPDGQTPVFPELQILVDTGDSPQPAQPSVLALRIDGRDCGTASNIQPFASSGHGIAAAFTIDVSGSMKGRPLNAIRAGLARFVDDAGPQDSVAIQTIADDARWDAPWNTPHPQVRAALQDLASRGRLTRLWDGAFIAVHSFDRQPANRRLIIISDGHDEGSVNTEEQVIAAAHDLGIVVDSIGMTRSNPVYLKSLSRLSAVTGGYFRQAANEQQLEQLVGSGIKRLKALPLASFVAGGMEADGKAHTFTVTYAQAGQTAQAVISAPFPPAPAGTRSDRLIWIVTGTVVCILAILFLVSKSKRKPRAASSPVAPAPPFAAAAAAVSFPPAPAGFPAAAPAATPRPPAPAPAAFSAPVPAPARRQRVEPVPAQASQAPPVSNPPDRSFVRAQTKMAHYFEPPSADRPSAWLQCEKGLHAGQEFGIDNNEFWIGALDNNHLRLEHDSTVSGNHACVVFDHGVLGIFDYKSTNGTYVNNERVGDTRQLLSPGDRIQIGRSVFVVQPSRMQAVGG